MSDDDNDSGGFTNDHESINALFDTGNPTDIPAPQSELLNENWLSTGIAALDRYLSGGIPPGRLVTFSAPADTQGELFIKQIASQHDSLYLTSLRPEWEVEETVRDHVQRVGSVDAGKISTRVRNLDRSARLEQASEYLEDIGNGWVVVIDAVDELEKEAEPAYIDFLHQLKQRLWESGSVGLLNCFEGDATSHGREITFRMSDIIWQLRRSVAAGGVEYLLDVSKFRGGSALTEPVKLELTDEIGIDTSRDIA